MREPVVRAVDVGYGHVKYTLGRQADGTILCGSFPSLSPGVREVLDYGTYMERRNTFIVEIDGRRYEVGKDVVKAVHANSEGSVMDIEFAMSDAYRARLYGALNYIAQDLDDNTLDVLILGLPLNTYTKHKKALSARFTGELTISGSGDTLQVRHCQTYPQPFGSYLNYLESNQISHFPVCLVVDIGYNTCDWFVCEGLTPRLSGVSLRGMGAVMNAMAKDVIQTTKFDGTESEVMRLIDVALTSGEQFKLCGKPVNLEKPQKVGEDIIEEGAQSVKNAVRSAGDIDVIIVTGGGAPFFKDAIQKKFRSHEVRLLTDSSLGNVRGFHVVGENLGRSLSKAMALGAAA